MKRTIAHLSGWLTRVRVRLTRWLRKAGPGSHEAAALLAVTAPAAASATSMAAIPELAERSLVAAPLAARSQAAIVAPAPLAPLAGPTVATIVADDATAAVPARRFFARMLAAGPEGLVVDFAEWQRAPVERFFLAFGATERLQRRGAAFAEVATIEDAFADFAWD